MSAGAAHLGGAPPREARTARSGAGVLVAPLAAARAVAFAALALWGALHWMAMLEPSEPGRAWTVVGVGGLAVAALLGAGRLPGRRRGLAACAACVPLAALMLLAGGVADELLRPDGWGELAAGISRGVSDLPGVRVPYRGLDPWVRTVIPLGGSALVLVAALLAFWPRRSGLGRPVGALLVLTVLYVVPVVALDFDLEFLRGAAFALLTVLFLRLEKLRAPDAAAAGALALGIVVLALGLAPILNRDQPWFDYETWALETSASKSTAYSWDQDYTGLKWPRDGRELLRVRAQRPAYWKTENLDVFDGRRWARSDLMFAVPDIPDPSNVKASTQRLRFSIRNLRSDQYVTAGFATDLDMPPLRPNQSLDGLYAAPRTLHRGDTYTVMAYTPRPTEAQRRRAGKDYVSILRAYAMISVPTRPGEQRISRSQVWFPFFGADTTALGSGPPVQSQREILARMQAAGLGRTFALAQQLKRGARTPDEYVQRVLDHLAGDGFTYTEAPPVAAHTLEGFLFDAKTGYCQQYSGAMALLLRMAGIPARVSTGFSTGATDSRTGEYVVRDFDAHSWVEVYYPHWGWVTFDPTPAASPARSQPSDSAAAGGSGSGTIPSFTRDLPSERGAGVAVAAQGPPWWRWPALGLGALAVLSLAVLGVRRRRRGAPPALSELERALRRSRREPSPATTLHALELRFAGTPAAAGYLRTLREARYRGTPAHPTRAQRRGLRAELGRGGGLRGRLRAWWALPPR